MKEQKSTEVIPHPPPAGRREAHMEKSKSLLQQQQAHRWAGHVAGCLPCVFYNEGHVFAATKAILPPLLWFVCWFSNLTLLVFWFECSHTRTVFNDLRKPVCFITPPQKQKKVNGRESNGNLIISGLEKKTKPTDANPLESLTSSPPYARAKISPQQLWFLCQWNHSFPWKWYLWHTKLLGVFQASKGVKHCWYS